MDKSIDLMERALKGRTMVELADEIGVQYTALVNARKVGHVSALLAGQIAVFLNENAEHWMAVAAIESARDGKAKRLLEKHLEALVNR